MSTAGLSCCSGAAVSPMMFCCLPMPISHAVPSGTMYAVREAARERRRQSRRQAQPEISHTVRTDKHQATRCNGNDKTDARCGSTTRAAGGKKWKQKSVMRCAVLCCPAPHHHLAHDSPLANPLARAS